MKINVLLIAFLTFSPALPAQDDWALKLNKDGIKVYTKNLENSPYKAIKTVCFMQSSLARLTAVLLDINNSADWVYSTKKCVLLKQFSPADLVYYSEIEVPWPVNNRDFVVRLKVTQDEKTRAVTILGENKPAFVPENKNIVRIQRSYSKWIITPAPGGQLKIEYLLEVDPGGAIPAWLINMFATKGPFETFRNLRTQVRKPIYNQVTLAFIRN
jgi:hypothetical protein